jgi:hypothetical protein
MQVPGAPLPPASPAVFADASHSPRLEVAVAAVAANDAAASAEVELIAEDALRLATADDDEADAALAAAQAQKRDTADRKTAAALRLHNAHNDAVEAAEAAREAAREALRCELHRWLHERRLISLAPSSCRQPW